MCTMPRTTVSAALPEAIAAAAAKGPPPSVDAAVIPTAGPMSPTRRACPARFDAMNAAPATAMPSAMPPAPRGQLVPRHDLSVARTALAPRHAATLATPAALATREQLMAREVPQVRHAAPQRDPMDVVNPTPSSAAVLDAVARASAPPQPHPAQRRTSTGEVIFVPLKPAAKRSRRARPQAVSL